MQCDDKQLLTQRLAIQIADNAARTDIEINCPSFTDDGREPAGIDEIRAAWYDISQADFELRDIVLRAADYLKLRKLIERHPANFHWIRVVDS